MRALLPRPVLALLAAGAAATLACAPTPGVRGTTEKVEYFGNTRAPQNNVFRFNLGAEPEMIDPGLAVGQPDGRVCRILFEGLVIDDPRTLEPLPGQAYRWDIDEGGTRYTFHLRPGLTWSDGRPIVAADFRWSWLRVLLPETASRYSGMFAPISGAEAFAQGKVTDPNSVGIAAPDDSTLVVKLRAPTAYFLHVLQFYSALPCPQHVIVKHGRRWTLPQNIVSNGPFTLAYWRQNNRYEFVPNERYWDRANVKLDRIVAYTIDDLNTSTNLYKAGVLDWNPSGYIPSPFIPHMRDFADFRHGPYQGVYFYSINVTRKPFDNVDVRRALTYSVDREAIANDLLKRSRDPWGNFTPDGYPGYSHPEPIRYDPERARRYLAAAGYPGGKGFPTFEILFNTSEDHRRIAEAIQAMWRRELSIDVRLSNQEWGSYLDATTNLRYEVARRSWIGDYLDPNTFLASYITDDGNNRTGWSNRRYDALIAAAGIEMDAAKRFGILAEAEALLLDEAPVIPIYHYSTNELVKPYVRGIYQTPLDVHPLTHVSIDRSWKETMPAQHSSNASPETP